MKNFGKFMLAFVPVIMILTIFFGSEIVSILLFMAGSFITGGYDSLFSSLQNMMNHTTMLTFIMYLCGAIPAALWYYFGFYRKGKALRTNTWIRPSSFGLIALLGLGLYKAVDLLMIFLSAVMPQAMKNYSDLIESSNLGELSFLAIITTVILAPVVEELVFRGLTLRLFRRSGVPFFMANILQAVLFGLYHMNLIQGIYAALLGLFLGYLANRYRTLLASMTLHAVFNFCGTILTQLDAALFQNFFVQLLLMITGVLLSVAIMHLIQNQQPKKAPQAMALGIPNLRQTPYDQVEGESFI
ncbi:MAG: CPBP family intramembrane metalloprotease [Lachnospiraceae bacterium]|nr:CPBP family intramembrane metalloprotease [Lachnospiraceae bacterium]